VTPLQRFLAGLLLWMAAAGLAWAHKPSDAYLSITLGNNGQLAGQWDIALRDLDNALELDADGDGAITWGELKSRHGEIAALAGSRLVIESGGQRCSVAVGEQLVDEHTDGAYSVLPLTIGCPALGPELVLRYTLFAELDPQHRGLLKLGTPHGGGTAVLAADKGEQRVSLGPAEPGSGWAAFGQYLKEGVWHIWIGFDHILFLLSLLLPAVVQREAGRWRAAERLPTVGWDVLRVVTAFTLAHSITLTLATLEWVTLPSRWVESTIAASVVLAALNNVWPLMNIQRWWLAFAFGMVHGFGFASVLSDLGLPAGQLLLALVGFNLGVEIGQLAIVAVFLPLAFALRRTQLYRRGVLVAGSMVIALLAAAWFVERAFEVQLLPA
jgi:hypothetical protein